MQIPEETPQETQPLITERGHRWTKQTMNIFILIIIAFIISIGILVSLTTDASQVHKKNVILLISDGFGPASETYGRVMYQKFNNLSIKTQTPLEKMLIGQSRTSSFDSLITDSAAGSTAFSCGIKTVNFAVGVDHNKKSCGTILEAAKNKRYSTGLVVTSRITHATPAAFSAHVGNRLMESKIAEQQLGFYSIGRSVDLMFGGGKCFFVPKNKGGCRSDNKDLIKEGEKAGWNYVYSKDQLNKLDINNLKLPLSGLFSNSVLFLKYLAYGL